MRLWSLQPSYLDAKGLVACWREGLLARKVLLGETRGYQHHPQLVRFQAHRAPVAALDRYLLGIWEEATRRGYTFNREKIGARVAQIKIKVTDGQLAYELLHLKTKLKMRDPAHYRALVKVQTPLPHPMFKVVPGEIAVWEKIRATD